MEILHKMIIRRWNYCNGQELPQPIADNRGGNSLVPCSALVGLEVEEEKYLCIDWSRDYMVGDIYIPYSNSFPTNQISLLSWLWLNANNPDKPTLSQSLTTWTKPANQPDSTWSKTNEDTWQLTGHILWAPNIVFAPHNTLYMSALM